MVKILRFIMLIIIMPCMLFVSGCGKSEYFSKEFKLKEYVVTTKEGNTIKNTCNDLGTGLCNSITNSTFFYDQEGQKLIRIDENFHDNYLDEVYYINKDHIYSSYIDEDGNLKYSEVGCMSGTIKTDSHLRLEFFIIIIADGDEYTLTYRS